MGTTSKIQVRDDNPLQALQDFFSRLLMENELSGLLAPGHLQAKGLVMPHLFHDPEDLSCLDPLAPAFPVNAAQLLCKLTKKDLEGKIAAILRPCEIRAFIELIKFNQGNIENVFLIGVDCLGAYKNTDYHARTNHEDPFAFTRQHLQSLLQEKTPPEELEISRACKTCVHPIPQTCDLIIGLFGVDYTKELLLLSNSAKGEGILTRMEMQDETVDPSRQELISEYVDQRRELHNSMLEETREATKSMHKLSEYLCACTNCYNCRVACPVCYCRECVFVTDVFDHDPEEYLSWASKKGVLKMPTDTVFYHLTRLAHISTSCVGCGQCSNACPNNVPVMELFQLISEKTQQAFEYEAGRSLEEPPPLSVFQEEEFVELSTE